MFLTFLNPCSSEMPSCFPKRIIGAMEKHQSVYCVILLLKMFSITLQPKPAQIPSEASAHDCTPTVSCCRWLYVCTVWSQQVTILSASGRWDPFFPLCSLFNLPLWDFSSREFAIVGLALGLGVCASTSASSQSPYLVPHHHISHVRPFVVPSSCDISSDWLISRLTGACFCRRRT